MESIERFKGKLRRAREIMGKRLSSQKGQEKIAGTLEEIEKIEETLRWMPKPEKPGNGVVGGGTKRMSKGKLP
jgi:hypothetical protein